MSEISIENRVFGDRFRATKAIKHDRGIATLLAVGTTFRIELPAAEVHGLDAEGSSWSEVPA